MKNLFLFFIAIVIISSCSKKDKLEDGGAPVDYIVRVAAIGTDDSKTFTPLVRVKSGKVAIEFETSGVSNIKEYRVETSANGIDYSSVKSIIPDLTNQDKIYRDTIQLK